MSRSIPARAKRYPLAPGARLVMATHTSHDGAVTITRLARSRNALEKSGDRVTAYRRNDTGDVSLVYCRGRLGTPGYVEHHAITYAASFDDMDVEAYAVEHLTRCGPVVAWCASCGRPLQAGSAMCCPKQVKP